MGHPERPRTGPDEAADALATIAAQRRALTERAPRRPRWYQPAMALPLGAGIAVGALHNDLAGILAVPFVLYGFAGLAGIGEWQRVGLVRRWPPWPATTGLALYLLVALPGVWAAAFALDLHGHHSALPVAGALVPLPVMLGRSWVNTADGPRPPTP